MNYFRLQMTCFITPKSLVTLIKNILYYVLCFIMYIWVQWAKNPFFVGHLIIEYNTHSVCRLPTWRNSLNVKLEKCIIIYIPQIKPLTKSKGTLNISWKSWNVEISIYCTIFVIITHSNTSSRTGVPTYLTNGFMPNFYFKFWTIGNQKPFFAISILNVT